ncbi:hypothetical protein LA080_011070 [Diaporthe eres]|nr:hypothetical protein LA080_011070 [Diaporthe eres]
MKSFTAVVALLSCTLVAANPIEIAARQFPTTIIEIPTPDCTFRPTATITATTGCPTTCTPTGLCFSDVITKIESCNSQKILLTEARISIGASIKEANTSIFPLSPTSSLPPNPLYLPAYPPATYPRPKETLCSRPPTSSNRQLHSLSGFTTVHPSNELALSISRLTMGRSPFQAVNEQDDTALDPH